MRLLLILLTSLGSIALAFSQTAAPQPPEANDRTGDPKFSSVRAELLLIHEEDQRYRRELDAAGKAGRPDLPGKNELIKKMRAADAVNLPKVEAILAEHGWLGPMEVGKQANGVLFLVIQHSDLATQKKYLPMMRTAVQAGKARGASLALLEDRIALGEGRPQIYGSQLRSENNGPLFVPAIEDPDHLDERRAAVGLAPMAEYLKHWNLTWDLDAYKRELPHLLEKLAPPKSANRPGFSINER